MISSATSEIFGAPNISYNYIWTCYFPGDTFTNWGQIMYLIYIDILYMFPRKSETIHQEYINHY